MSTSSKLERLIGQDAYKIEKVKSYTSIISLHGEEIMEIGNNQVDFFIKALNGAYKEGVMNTLIEFKIDLGEISDVPNEKAKPAI